ncbi:P-loop containing nucleoside triphosphate hydrolase [Podospora fimiseda]|uniref:P-loop containing nucleoside triphosphate hydrolase n=1 Tax=Podospora fimiseda TaxID=252190 RepID=A0AAN7BPV7_9PEZI|nr:P-loop containing nucleoside triphosphate hydrolase [Podospora fimiseda]
MPYRVFAFVLRSRKWDGYRRMIVSLVSQHFRNRDSSSGRREQVDIVKGKGKGLILLLHGAPGVGKTSTTEGVAEHFKKPLFQITCGDLGTTAKEVEMTLETNFALTSRWGCILLLDEADLFLAVRTKHDFIRNGLVAAFLRVMEYYTGILFLTTNRVGDFDEAFKSRIHISLYYRELTQPKTIDVFALNMDIIEERFRSNGKSIEIDKVAIGSFASEHFANYPHARWNGRQIRNACQTALALAEFEVIEERNDSVIKLTIDHFKTVQKAYLDFAKYIQDLFGTNSARRAKEDKLRAIVLDELENDQIVFMDRRQAFKAAAQAQAQPTT